MGPAMKTVDHKENLRTKAEKWLTANPKVYPLFERFALEAFERGKPFGAKLLAERVRWECLISSRDDAGYKVNNNYTAYVARKLVEDHPKLGNVMRFRQTKY